MSESLIALVRHMFHPDTHPETFDDGFESFFGQQLEQFVLERGQLGVLIIAALIMRNELNEEYVSEAMRWMGWITDENSYRARYGLLVRNLNHKNARVRDSAALGLSSLGDISAIPYVEAAIENEQVPELKQDMQQVLDYLVGVRDDLRG